jgi:hypothetical protein
MIRLKRAKGWTNVCYGHEIRDFVNEPDRIVSMNPEMHRWIEPRFMMKQEVSTPEEKEHMINVDLALDILSDMEIDPKDYHRAEQIKDIISDALNRPVSVTRDEHTGAPKFTVVDIITTCDVPVSGLIYVFTRDGRFPFVYDGESLRLWCMRNGPQTNDPCTNLRYDDIGVCKILDGALVSIVTTSNVDMLDLYLTRFPHIMDSTLKEHGFTSLRSSKPRVIVEEDPGEEYDDYDDDNDEGIVYEDETEDESLYMTPDEILVYRENNATQAAVRLDSISRDTNTRVFAMSNTCDTFKRFIPFVLIYCLGDSVIVLLKHGMDLFAPVAPIERGWTGPLQGNMIIKDIYMDPISPILLIITEACVDIFGCIVDYFRKTGDLVAFMIKLLTKEPGDKYSLFELVFVGKDKSAFKRLVLETMIENELLEIANVDLSLFLKQTLIHCYCDQIENVLKVYENVDPGVYIDAFREIRLQDDPNWRTVMWMIHFNKLDLYANVDGTCPFYFMIDAADRYFQCEEFIGILVANETPVSSGMFYPTEYASIRGISKVANIFARDPRFSVSLNAEMMSNPLHVSGMILNVSERLKHDYEWKKKRSKPGVKYEAVKRLILLCGDINAAIDGRYSLFETAVQRRNLWLMMMILELRKTIDRSRLLQVITDPDFIIESSQSSEKRKKFYRVVKEIVSKRDSSNMRRGIHPSQFFARPDLWESGAIKLLKYVGAFDHPDFVTCENIFNLCKIETISHDVICNMLTPQVAHDLVGYSQDMPFFFMCVQQKRFAVMSRVRELENGGEAYAAVHDNDTLFTFAMKNNITRVSMYSNSINFDPNVCVDMGVPGNSGTALYHSSKSSKFNIFTSCLLRNRDADIRVPGEDGMAPIMNSILVANSAAVTWCFVLQYIEREYIFADVRNNSGMGIMHALFVSEIQESMACHIAKHLLLREKELATQRDNLGETPLMYAIKKRKAHALKLLLENGATPTTVSETLHVIKLAIQNDNLYILDKLMTPSLAAIEDDDDMFMIQYTLKWKKYEMFVFLAEKIRSGEHGAPEFDALTYAAECNFVEAACYMLQTNKNAAADALEHSDISALYEFISHGNIEGTVLIADAFKAVHVDLDAMYPEIMNIVMIQDNVEMFTFLYDTLLHPEAHQNKKYCDLHCTWAHRAPKIRNFLKERGKSPSIDPNMALANFDKWMQLSDQDRNPFNSSFISHTLSDTEENESKRTKTE